VPHPSALSKFVDRVRSTEPTTAQRLMADGQKLARSRVRAAAKERS